MLAREFPGSMIGSDDFHGQPHSIPGFILWPGTSTSVCEFLVPLGCMFQLLVCNLPHLFTPLEPFVYCRGVGWVGITCEQGWLVAQHTLEQG